MNKTILLIFTFFISVSTFAKSGKIVLYGQVENHSIESISISYLNNKELVSAKLGVNGEFKISAKIESGYYFLKYGRNTAYIYLHPKDKIRLIFDAKNFESSLIYKGKGAVRNNYLINKSKIGAKLTEDLNAFYKVDEIKYLENIQNVKDTHLNSLLEYDVKDYFKKAEFKSLEYERLLSIQNYKSNYKFYLGDEISPTKDFYNPIKELNINNKNDYKTQPYYRYLLSSIWGKRIDEAKNVDEMLKVLKKVPSEDLTISLINSCYSKISSKKERAKDYLDLIKRVTTHKPFIEAAEKQYKEAIASKGLKKGNVSPEFEYENIDGTKISLKNFRGKYVYIDVWATWCSPCIKQVPYLRKLEKKYHNKNIVFVSISVDKVKMKSTWKQFVAKKELGGVQLFADKSFDSDFMNSYGVNSIPRFILIDPVGNIIDAEAPRPSFDKTLELLDRLLN